MVLEKIFKFCQCIFTISLLPPLRNGHDPSFEQTWILFTQWCFVTSFAEISPVVLEKMFKFLQCIFSYFAIIFSWKMVWPFNWTNLNPFHPRMLCAKHDWNWFSGSAEENFLIYVFLLFRNHFPLEKGTILHLNKLESTLPKDVLCQVWLN